MNRLTPVVVSSYPCILGECPVWDVEKKRLFWVDILAGNIHQLHPESGNHSIFSVGKLTGSIALREGGGLIAALKDGFSEIDTDSGTVGEPIVPDGHPDRNVFNDGKCDPAGRFWAGSMAPPEFPGTGSLYMLDSNRTVSVKIESVTISNGMAWTADEKTFYYIDTPAYSIVAFDYHAEDGAIANKREIIKIPAGFGDPDGMTIDTEGMLWIAFWDGWKIGRWNPISGKLLFTINLPVAKVTSCTFGGENLDDLYITTARKDLSERELIDQPLAGATFVVRNCGYSGRPAHRFIG
ncbi:MAG TPA: SMP-30/gluconolactonase/LRE family protein [Mucilaginibacter sp.]|jgi:sugar lactone lactonase YvrE